MTNALIELYDETPVVSSRSVAENFEKRHDSVLRTIENLISNGSTQNRVLTEELESMFFETNYQAGTGKNYKEYLMNRDGFSLIVMGFTGKKALEWKLKYIAAFNEMEQKLKQNQTLQLISLKNLTSQLSNLANAVNQFMSVSNPANPPVKGMTWSEVDLETEVVYKPTDIAKEFGMSAQKLNRILAEEGIQYQDVYNNKNYWRLCTGYDPALAKALPYEVTSHTGERRKYLTLKWTEKGREFITKILASKGYTPKDKKSF